MEVVGNNIEAEETKMEKTIKTQQFLYMETA